MSTGETLYSTSSQPSVSVLIPCSNVEFLAECLASVDKQDYQNIEVLVVLNGSVLGMSDELRVRFSSINRPLRFLSIEEVGIVNALNYGLENCQNELIARMDADDLMPTSRIRLQVDAFQEDPELICVGGQMQYLDSMGNYLHPGYPETHKEIVHALYRFSALPHPGVMFRKSALTRIGGYRNNFPHIEDWDLWVRLSEVGKIVNLPVTTVLYRVHPNQITEIHSSEQGESVLAFSLSRLRSCLKDPKNMTQMSGELSGDTVVREVISCLVFVRTPICVNGAFGRKEVRRRFAGYLYSNLKCRNSRGLSSRVRIIFLSLLVVSVDPRILYLKTMNQFRRISRMLFPEPGR